MITDLYLPFGVHLQLRLGGILPDGPEDGAELLGVDDAVVVRVELEEGVLEGADLLLRQALRRHSEFSVPTPPFTAVRICFQKPQETNRLLGPAFLQTLIRLPPPGR